MTVLIFANGEIEGVAWIRPYLAVATAVIAADGGTRHLKRLNHLPDLVIGDVDSLDDGMRQWLQAANVPMQIHPPAKDETDLELALIYAAQTYPDDILLFGTLGGRLDQTLANILLLTHPALAGRHVQLVTHRERAWLVNDHAVIVGNEGDTVSLIPLGGDVTIRNTTGLAWPLQNEQLSFGLARGVSNVMTGSQAEVDVVAGP
ncbi:MAG: thiamine diphosphokinase [Chloroflexi bacterium]|nr:thiamine diphosphokinase [Chloroflexota bacterium]